MEVRRLRIDDLDSFFECRLRALKQDPNAFMMTYEEESAKGPGHFQSVLAKNEETNVIFGAIDGARIVATAGLFQESRTKNRHKAILWGMFVEPEQRGKGLGGKLLNLVIEHAHKTMKARSLLISVEATNTSARALYEKHGFKKWGTEPRAMKVGESFLDEDQMVLLLD